MSNTQLKFEGTIHYGSKVVAFTRNYTKFLSSIAYLTLRSRSPDFKPFDTFRCSINSSSLKVKFETVQCVTVKIKILEV